MFVNDLRGRPIQPGPIVFGASLPRRTVTATSPLELKTGLQIVLCDKTESVFVDLPMEHDVWVQRVCFFIKVVFTRVGRRNRAMYSPAYPARHVDWRDGRRLAASFDLHVS